MSERSAPTESGAPGAGALAWHALPVEAVASALASDAVGGLSPAQAAERLGRDGPNAVAAGRPEPWWEEIVESLTEPLVLLLIAVGVLYALLGEIADAITIFVVIVLVAAIEVLNESRARRAIGALGTLVAPTAVVRRDGRAAIVPAAELVVGDLVLLHAGDRVPADLRLVATSALRVDESALTGESLPAAKRTDQAEPDAELADRPGCVYAGSLVVGGWGSGLVVAIGAATEAGRIGALVAAAREPRTPLQQQMRHLAGVLLRLAVVLSLLVPLAGFFVARQPWREMLLTGLTLAFATIPEELPILITIVLGLGALGLARQHAAVKRLRAAETLGSVSILATDKTGTLTENRMRLAVIEDAAGLRLEPDEVEARPTHPTVPATAASQPLLAPEPGSAASQPLLAPGPDAVETRHIVATEPDAVETRRILAPESGAANRRHILATAARASEAPRRPTDRDSSPVVDTAGRASIGSAQNVDPTAQAAFDPALVVDPTERAVIEAAVRAGLAVPDPDDVILTEIPFDEHRRRAATLYTRAGERWLALKGAPESVVPLCTTAAIGSNLEPLSAERVERIIARAEAMAAGGLRTLAVAERRLDSTRRGDAPARDRADGAMERRDDPAAPVDDLDGLERELTFLGLIGLEDPPRAAVAPMVAALGAAGVRVLMLTGDHPATAASIARQVGIDAARVVRGREVDRLSVPELADLAERATIFARITPEHKLRVVRALQARGEVVAVTGDGVNDAPALREAAIGVAMGRSGTAAAREAADLVLLDDNIGTIVTAVRAGRQLYENLRKAVRYYLAAKVALIVASLGATLIGLPVPFAPVQIIVLELFMDLGASTTFVAEPPEDDVLARPPRDPRQPFLDRAMLVEIAAGGLTLAAAVLGSYAWATASGFAPPAARTVAFAAWMVGHVALAAHLRSERQPLLTRNPLANRVFVAWASAAVALPVLGGLVPFLAERLHLTALPPIGWLVAFAAGLLLPAWLEAAKWTARARSSEVGRSADRAAPR